MSAASPIDPSRAFAEDLERERPPIIRYLQGKRVPPPDQKELAGDIILAAWSARSTYNPDRAALRTWLRAIASNLLSHYRKLARHRREQLAQPDEFSSISAEDLDAELHLILEEHRAILETMLEKIPAERRKVFILHELEDMKLSEIAHKLGLSEDTVWSRLRLARDDLLEIAKRWHAAEAHRGRRRRSALFLPMLGGAGPLAPVSLVARLTGLAGMKWIQVAAAGILLALLAPHDAGPERAPALPSHTPRLAELRPLPVVEPPPAPPPPLPVEPPAAPPPRAIAPRVAPPRRHRPAVPGAEHHHIQLALTHQRAGRIARAIAALEDHARAFPQGALAAQRARMLRELRRK